jgi:glycosyltransferase involved in cell wall biosynthesis
MPKISIAMATFNGESFVGEQLESFARQTQLPDEIVVTDDGSSDRTLAIVERFAAAAPFPVKLFRNSVRLDYSRNFERAMSLCSGDIIFLSDQDDVWFPYKIEVVTAAFESDPEAQVLVNDQILTDATLQHSNITKLQNLRRIGKDENALVEGCCTAIKRSWSERLLPIPQEADELLKSRVISYDTWINEISTLLGVRRVVERPLQYFRRTGSNTTSWFVSEPHRVGKRDLIKRRLAHPPMNAWKRREAVLELYAEFLESHRHDVGDVTRATKGISHERVSLAERSKLARLPRRRRAISVWRLWRNGGYEYFEGWLSALHDIIRTPASNWG